MTAGRTRSLCQCRALVLDQLPIYPVLSVGPAMSAVGQERTQKEPGKNLQPVEQTKQPLREFPPHFPLSNGNSLLHGKCSPKKLYLNVLQTVWEQEKGSEVLALLLEPGRAQGRVKTSPPQRLQPQQLLGRGSRAGDGACARMTRAKRDLI